MIDFSVDSRHRALDEAAEADVLIVGGGITGAGIALDAAARGLSVLLVEKSDFVSGTSSKSTKLVHGGLRYLRQLQFGLVREAARERSILRRLAPHLVEEIGFLIPVRRFGQRWSLGPGLWLYDALGGFRGASHRFLDAGQAAGHFPGLPLVGAYRFGDCKADDCRLTLHVLKKAAQLGAKLVHYAEVLRFTRDGGRVNGVRVLDRIRNRETELRGRVVVLAAGVWADELLAREESQPKRRLRPTKGIHLVVRRSLFRNSEALLIPPGPDGRVLFVIPWGHFNIVGTTDTDHAGPLDGSRAGADDVAGLVARVQEGLGVEIGRSDIRATYSGLRPLPVSGEVNPSRVPRDYAITDTSSGLVVVTGGKLTTFRAMGRKAVDHLLKRLGRPWTGSLTHRLDLFAPRGEAPPALAAAYGSEAAEVVRDARPEDLRPIDETSAHLAAEVDYSVRSEACATVTDFLSRRTRSVLFAPHQGRRSAEPVARRMARILGWDEGEIRRQIDAYDAELELHAVP